MGRKIILLNIIYYSITIGLIKLGQDNPSNSLGYGYFIIIFWIIFTIALLFLLIKKVIRPKSLFEKIGTFTLTPFLSIIVIILFLTVKENVSSEWYFDKNNYHYKERTIDNDRSTGGKRIEYYKNIDTFNSKETWIKDSVWLYISKAGDTIKRVKYRSGVEVK